MSKNTCCLEFLFQKRHWHSQSSQVHHSWEGGLESFILRHLGIAQNIMSVFHLFLSNFESFTPSQDQNFLTSKMTIHQPILYIHIYIYIHIYMLCRPHGKKLYIYIYIHVYSIYIYIIIYMYIYIYLYGPCFLPQNKIRSNICKKQLACPRPRIEALVI